MRHYGLPTLAAALLLALALPAQAQNKLVEQMKGTRKKQNSAAPAKPAAAAEPARPVLPPDAPPDAVLITIKAGDAKERVVFKLRPDLAPRTVEQFRKNVETDFYKGQAFHRVIRNYLVQTGDPQSKDDANKEQWGTGDIGTTLPKEFSGKHSRGAVAMARKNDDVNPNQESSGSQFYICLKDISELDGKYTVFGEIITGMDVLIRLSGAVVDTNDVPLKRIEIDSMQLIRSDSRLAQEKPSSGIRKTKPDGAKGPVEKFIERVW